MLRDPADADEMKDYFRDIRLGAPEIKVIRRKLLFTHDELAPPHFLYGIRILGDRPRMLAIVWDGEENPWSERDPKVDWACFEARNDELEELKNGKMTSATARLLVRAAKFYDGEFADSSKWQAYHLWEVGQKRPWFGYARQNSTEAKVLSGLVDRHTPEAMTKPVILKISAKGDSHLSRQFVIDEVVSRSWVMENE
jgi:hypothetical protein